jgi:hypothetical protein
MVRDDGGRTLYPNLPFATPTARGATVSHDLRWTWTRRMMAFAGGFEWAVALVLAAAAGRLGRGRLAKPVLAAASGVGVLFYGVAAVYYAAAGEARMAGATWSFLASQAVMLAGLSVLEARLVPALFATGVLNALAGVLRQLVFFPGGTAGEVVAAIALSPATPAAAFAAFISTLRRRALSRAGWLVAGDRAVYDGIWAEIAGAAGAAERLEELRGLVKELGGSKEAPRQGCRGAGREVGCFDPPARWCVG